MGQVRTSSIGTGENFKLRGSWCLLCRMQTSEQLLYVLHAPSRSCFATPLSGRSAWQQVDVCRCPHLAGPGGGCDGDGGDGRAPLSSFRSSFFHASFRCKDGSWQELHILCSRSANTESTFASTPAAPWLRRLLPPVLGNKQAGKPGHSPQRCRWRRNGT